MKSKALRGICSILLCGGIAVTGIACSSDSSSTGSTSVTTSSESNTIANESEVAEVVLMDDDNFKVTYTGKNEGSLGAEIKLLIENKADRTLCLQTEEVSVDGLMTNSDIFSSEVSAGMKAKDSITIMDEDIESLDDLKNIKGKFVVCDLNDWDFESYRVDFSID